MRIIWKFKTKKGSYVITHDDVEKINELIMNTTLEEIGNNQVNWIIKKDESNNYMNQAISIMEK